MLRVKSTWIRAVIRFVVRCVFRARSSPTSRQVVTAIYFAQRDYRITICKSRYKQALKRKSGAQTLAAIATRYTLQGGTLWTNDWNDDYRARPFIKKPGEERGQVASRAQIEKEKERKKEKEIEREREKESSREGGLGLLMKLATSNPALSEPFRDTGRLRSRWRPHDQAPGLICDVTEPGRRSGTIKAGGRCSRGIYVWRDTQLKSAVRALKNVSSNGTYARDRTLRAA